MIILLKIQWTPYIILFKKEINTDIITGSIIKAIEVKDARTLCQRPFDEISYGCTLGVGEKEYYIVYASSTARIHEECHALYEKFDHMW